MEEVGGRNKAMQGAQPSLRTLLDAVTLRARAFDAAGPFGVAGPKGPKAARASSNQLRSRGLLTVKNAAARDGEAL